MKVIKSLENRGILLKGTTTKVTSQEGGFLNFLRSLMTSVLPLMKSVLTPLLEVFCTNWIISSNVTNKCSDFFKKNPGSGTQEL